MSARRQRDSDSEDDDSDADDDDDDDDSDDLTDINDGRCQTCGKICYLSAVSLHLLIIMIKIIIEKFITCP